MKVLFWVVLCIFIFVAWYALNEDRNNQSKMKEPVRPLRPQIVGNPNAPVQKLNFFCVKDKGYHVSVWPNVQGYQGLDYIEFQIAGITHYKATAMKHLGESLAILAAEPDNPYDPNAIRILTSDWQLLGYVPRDMTDEIRRHTSLSCPCFIYIGYRPDEDTFFTDAYIKSSLSKS